MNRVASPSVTIVSLGIDLGTSSVKATLVASDGTTVAIDRRPLNLETPEGLGAEQDPELWWSQAVAAIRACASQASHARIAAVGLTGQKHALLPLDVRDRPLGPAVIWADGRSQAEAIEMARLDPGLWRRTGAPALPGYLVPKWLRFRRLRPEAAARTRRLCFAKDWLRLRLTGAHVTDPTEASASQLYDARRRTWSEELCHRYDISLDFLPPILPSSAIAGTVSEAAAAATGLEVGTPVVAGAGDNETAALACGAVEDGVVAVILGTSGTVVAPARRRRSAPGLVWGRHVTRRGIAATGVVLSAGRALDWCRAVLFGGDTPMEEVLEAAARGLEAPSCPLFVPSLAGERSPVPDPQASAAFVGLRPDHGPDEMAAAVLEGVAVHLGQTVERMRQAGVAVREVRLTSGGAESETWSRLVAAAVGVGVRAAGTREGPAWGAALLAAGPDATDAELKSRQAAWDSPGPVRVPVPKDVARLQRSSDRLARAREALARAR